MDRWNSTLHRELKVLYGGSPAECEVTVAGYRIDAVANGRLIEVQRASLGAIRDKIGVLLENHQVTLVKPIAARTLIVRRESAQGAVASRRFSPLRRSLFNLFEELVHFGTVFPHPRLQLEVVLIEQEERRIPKARRRFNKPDYRVEDRLLLNVVSRRTFRTAAELGSLLPADLKSPFHTKTWRSRPGFRGGWPRRWCTAWRAAERCRWWASTSAACCTCGSRQGRDARGRPSDG